MFGFDLKKAFLFEGLFVLNMICNDLTLRDATLRDLHSIWPHMLVNKLEKNRNEILFCSEQHRDQLFQKSAFKDKSDKNNNNSKNKGSDKTSDEVMKMLEEVAGHLKELKF